MRKENPMAADDFFARWSRCRTQETEEAAATTIETATGAEHADASSTPAEAPNRQTPTMEEVEQLTHESDYSRFVTAGVDESVKLSAMKKLFSDPRFNIMDGLDTYIEDYNTFEPIPPEMLQALNHAKALLDPLGQLEKPLMELVQRVVEPSAAVPAAAPAAAETADAALAPKPEACTPLSGAEQGANPLPDMPAQRPQPSAPSVVAQDTNPCSDDLA